MLQHKKEFASSLASMAEMYNRHLSKTSILLYYEALKQYEYKDVNKALNILVRESSFMPVVADIVKIIENRQSPDILAEQAYDKLIRAKREIGAYTSIIFDDPIIHRIVEQHGGWPAVCAMSKEEEQFTAFKKNFIQEYKAFMQDKNYSFPLKLAGIHEINNSAMAFDSYIPKAVLFGDIKKITQWQKKEKLKHTKSRTRVAGQSDIPFQGKL